MSVRLRDIAERAGVSVTTVSRVLNGRDGCGRISEKCVQSVRKIAAELDYRPDSAARAMVTRRTRTVGVLTVNNANRPYTCPQTYFTIIGINMALQAADYLLTMIRLTDVDLAGERQARVFREHCMDGLIIANLVPDDLALRAAQQVPACIWVDGNVWRDTCCVRRDERAAGQAATQLLIEGGHRRLIFVGHHPERAEHFSHIQRAEGAVAAASAASLQLEYFRPESAEQWQELLSLDAGLICDDENWCRRLIMRAAEFQRAPGHDFGLVCCEGTADMEKVWPDLSRVEFDRLAMGKAAAEMALRLIESGQEHCPSILLPSNVTAGKTAHRPPALVHA